jgi:hypothetical protein
MFAVHLLSRIALCGVAAPEHVVIGDAIATVRAGDLGELLLAGGSLRAQGLTRSRVVEELGMQEWLGVWCSDH